MKKIEICVGSSCHLKGSYEIIDLMKEAIQKYELENEVELKAAFCLGNCKDGVSVRIDNQKIVSFSTEHFYETFQSEILSIVKKG